MRRRNGIVKISKDPRVKKLLDAAEKGNVAAVKRLLDEGADPNAMLEDRLDNALMIAIYYRQVEVIRALGGGGKADFNGGFPHTPLTLGVRTQNPELIRALVEGGAKVNHPNSSGQTALHIAVQEGWIEAAAELVRLGADPNLVPKKKKYDTVTNYSPLEYAAMEGNKKLVDVLLLAPGVKPDERLGALMLCGAAIRGNLGEVKRLVEQEGVDVNARDARDATPLKNAALGGRTKVVRYLLDHGADVNRPGGKKSDGNSPLIEAAMAGNVEIVRMLVEAGADVGYEASGYDVDYDALAAAKTARQKKVVDYLLDLQMQRGGGSGGSGGGGGKKKGKGGGKPSTPRGVTTFDTNDAMLLVAAPVADVSKAFAERIGAKTRRENVLGDEVKLTQRCYAVWKLIDSPWTNVMKLHCRDFKHWPSAADAAALSKSLKTRALYVANSDTGGVTQYALFESGKAVEVFDYGSSGDADNAKAATERFAKYYGIDMSAIPGGVQAAEGKAFASSQRTVDVRKITNDLDFVNDYVKQQDAFIPFGSEISFGEAGEMMELTLEDLGPDDVERLDYVAVSGSR
jgi:ankyrin repeat protein